MKVKRDMKIEIAPEIFGVRKWNCKVVSNRNVATFIKELKLALPEGEEVPFRAGGYVQLECPPHRIDFKTSTSSPQFRDDWDKFDLWRFKSVLTEPVERAYSMANYPLEKGILLFTIRIAFPPDYRDRHPAGHHELLGLQPEAGRRGHGVRARSASSSPATRTRRCASSAAAPAWRRCARTSSTS